MEAATGAHTTSIKGAMAGIATEAIPTASKRTHLTNFLYLFFVFSKPV